MNRTGLFCWAKRQQPGFLVGGNVLQISPTCGHLLQKRKGPLHYQKNTFLN